MDFTRRITRLPVKQNNPILVLHSNTHLMNTQHNTTFRYLLAGILVLTVATTQAQSTGADSTMNHRDGFDQQDHRRPGFGPNRGGNFARRGFNRPSIRYTPEQRQQRLAINKEYRQKRADLFKQDNLTLKQYKAGLLNLEKEKKGRLATLLTPEQKNQLAANRKRMDDNRQVREAARLERLKLHLNLTDDQVAKIKTGNEDLHTQAKAIHENDNLLPQQKMEQIKTLMAKRNDTYKSVLTPDQYTEFESRFRQKIGGR